MIKIKDVEKIKTLILFSVVFFWKPCRLWENFEKSDRPQMIIGAENMEDYRHTAIKCNTYAYIACLVVIKFLFYLPILFVGVKFKSEILIFLRAVDGAFCVLYCYTAYVRSCLSLKMGQIGCPETSVNNYQPTLRDNPEDQRHYKIQTHFCISSSLCKTQFWILKCDSENDQPWWMFFFLLFITFFALFVSFSSSWKQFL
jgi:hypothetical protein